MHRLKGEAVLHHHLIPDDQLHVPEQTTQRPLPRYAAATRVVGVQWDLELRMSGPTVGEQCGGDPRGRYAENGLALCRCP